MNPEIQLVNPEIQHVNPEIQLAKPEIQLVNPEIQNSSREYRELPLSSPVGALHTVFHTLRKLRL